jgi:small subunit ribosomal protein S6e
MNIVISDPKTAKAYSYKSDKPVFSGKKLGAEVDLSVIGLEGYTGKITGGSDKNGFPLNPSLPGTTRKKIFIGKGVGFKAKRKGIRVRKTVRGRMVGEDVHQLNIKVVKAGGKPLAEIFKKEEKAEGKEEGQAEAKPEEKKEAKPEEKKAEKPKEEKPKEEKPKEEKPKEEKK